MRRSATVLVSSVLALSAAGLLPAGADPGTGAAGSGSVSGPVDASDPRGDARGGSAVARRLADARSVRYRVPQRDEGTFSATVRMTRVKKSEEGLRQTFVVRLVSLDGERQWLLAMNGQTRRVRVIEADADGDRRIQPESTSGTAVFGKNGRLSIAVSTEWLPVNRVRVRPAVTAAGNAFDVVRPGFTLNMSGRNGTTITEPVPPTPR